MLIAIVVKSRGQEKENRNRSIALVSAEQKSQTVAGQTMVKHACIYTFPCCLVSRSLIYINPDLYVASLDERTCSYGFLCSLPRYCHAAVPRLRMPSNNIVIISSSSQL